MRLNLSIACGDYDRTRTLFDDTVKPRGINPVMLHVPLGERNLRMLGHQEFDVCEFSLSSYIILKAASKASPFTAIPVFPSRAFRHSNILINTDSHIKEPRNLEGKRVGIAGGGGYQMTMAVWIRGILQDDYDVNPLKIKWYTQTEELIPVTYPEGLFAETLPARSNLFRMLEEGKLDALLWPQELEPTRRPVVARLFPDYASIETEYYARTQIYPIMHTLIVKSKILEQEPWVARSLYDAFLEAKDIGVEYSLSSMRVTLPHMQAVIEKSLELMGRDIGPYGIKKNRKTLETLIRYEHEQGLLAKHIGVEELFAETTLDL